MDVVSISGSVGKGGANNRADVLKIQKLLNANGASPKLAVDGIVGPKTIQAIVNYQSGFMQTADGRVDPGGKTLRRLNHLKSPEENANWGGDSSQWSQLKKLQSLTPVLRPKVSAVLAALTEQGFQPKIFFGWRSVAVQLELYKKKRTTVKFSFHNAQTVEGTPNSYAADIIDKRWAWQPAAKANGFWTALGAEAKKAGLYWGGDWVSFKDWAHVQLLPNSELGRIKKESGQ